MFVQLPMRLLIYILTVGRKIFYFIIVEEIDCNMYLISTTIIMDDAISKKTLHLFYSSMFFYNFSYYFSFL